MEYWELRRGLEEEWRDYSLLLLPLAFTPFTTLERSLAGEELLGSSLIRVIGAGGGESVTRDRVTKCNLSKIQIIGSKNKTGGISLALHIKR